MSDRTRAISRATCWFLVLTVVAVTAALADENRSPVLVRMLVRNARSVTPEAGVLVADRPGELVVFDLKTGRERTFPKSQIRSLINPATEQDVAAVTGIAPLVAWFVAESLPSRPKSGQIASVDGAVAYINRGLNVGIKEGERFDVFRGDGKEIVDPETGEVIGTTQKRIAQVEVVELREKLSKVRMTGDLEVELAVRDVVRPLAAEQAVAVLPLGRDSGQLIQGGVQLAEEMISGLTKNGVNVVERALLDKLLQEQNLASTGKFDADTVQRVGRLLQAQAIVTGTIQIDGRDANVNVRLIEVETGKLLYATSLSVKNLNKAPVRANIPHSAPATDTLPVPRLDPLPGVNARLRKLREMRADTHGVRSLRFSPDGTRAVTGGTDKTVRIWDLEKGIDVRQLAGHTTTVNCVDWLADGQTVVSADYAGVINVWNVESGEVSATFLAANDVRAMLVVGNGDQLVVGVRQKEEVGHIQVWNLRSKRQVRHFQTDAPVWAVDVSPDGKWIASGGAGGQIELRKFRGDHVRPLGSHGQLVTCVRFSPDGKLLLSSGFDGAIRFWNLESGEVIERLPTARDGSDVFLTPDQEFLITTGHGVHLWNMDSHTIVQSLDTQAGPGDLDPMGRLLLLFDGSKIELWEMPTPSSSSLSTRP